MESTENLKKTNTKLKRIAWLSERDPKKEFSSLMHHFNEESLTDCFHQLDKDKAVGIDGIDKASYAEKLEANIQDLTHRMKKMAYRPGPIKEVLIPKEGKPGATRPLGISNLEDKIVQKMMQKVLESIYEPLFQESSYGFRPGKSCHDAIRALQHHLYKNEVQTVIDVDLQNFFGTIDHHLLGEILQQKIKDTRLMRYIHRMLKAGVLSNGELRKNEEGVAQGSIASPILANIFAHYAIDVWIEEMVQPNCTGTVKHFRYADDIVICCQYKKDAERIKRSLVKRLEKFKLQLNEEKTKLVAFDKQQASRRIKQETFDFLGFTFYWGRSRRGHTIPQLKTRAKTLRAKLKKVKSWAKQEIRRKKKPLKEIWRKFGIKLRGHIQYYGVSHNTRSVKIFTHEATKTVFKWLNRRSQRKSYDWKRFNLFKELNPLPTVRIVHKLF